MPAPAPTPTARADDVVIDVRHLAKSYGSHVAVRDVGFTVHRGEVFGLLGPNGAGKTTTVECLTGLRERDGGTVEVLGLDPRTAGPELRQLVGCQLQESQLPARLRVGEALELYASMYARPADVRALADRLGLTAAWRTEYRALSGGQRQRVAIALALVGSPRVAVLDELTTGLDPQARRETWELVEDVRDQGVTVVLVTHLMDEAERLCDRIALVDDGRVVALDTPAGLARSSGAGHVVTFTTTDDDAAVRAALDEVAGLDEVEVRDGRVRLRGDDPVVPVVLALTRHHLTPRGLEARTATLDDAVVHLTRRAAPAAPAPAAATVQE